MKESAILISFLIRIEKNNGEKEKTALYVGDNFYSFEVPHWKLAPQKSTWMKQSRKLLLGKDSGMSDSALAVEWVHCFLPWGVCGKVTHRPWQKDFSDVGVTVLCLHVVKEPRETVHLL